MCSSYMWIFVALFSLLAIHGSCASLSSGATKPERPGILFHHGAITAAEYYTIPGKLPFMPTKFTETDFEIIRPLMRKFGIDEVIIGLSNGQAVVFRDGRDSWKISTCSNYPAKAIFHALPSEHQKLPEKDRARPYLSVMDPYQ